MPLPTCRSALTPPAMIHSPTATRPGRRSLAGSAGMQRYLVRAGCAACTGGLARLGGPLSAVGLGGNPAAATAVRTVYARTMYARIYIHLAFVQHPSPGTANARKAWPSQSPCIAHAPHLDTSSPRPKEKNGGRQNSAGGRVPCEDFGVVHFLPRPTGYYLDRGAYTAHVM